jgi:hypothetical protein
MKTPIIVDERGEVSIFETAETAEHAIEAVDVDNYKYIVYDARGQLLAFKAIGPNRQLVLEEAEPTPTHVENLVQTLISFLRRTGRLDVATSMSLDQLIQQFVAAHGYTR